MLEQEAQPGLHELISYLESRGVRMGLCTRNFEYVWPPFSFFLPFPPPSPPSNLRNGVRFEPLRGLCSSISYGHTRHSGSSLIIRRQHTRHAPPPDLPPGQDLRPDRHAGVPPPEARPRGDPAHRRRLGHRRRRGEPDHGRGLGG